MLKYIPIADALAHEATMLNRVVRGENLFECFLWETDQCLVAPRAHENKVSFRVASNMSAQEDWPVFHRNTGGDVTPQGPGIVNLSIAYAAAKDIRPSIADSYRQLCEPIFWALGRFNIESECGSVAGAFCDGAYNITIAHRKFAGTAQSWRRTKWDKNRCAVFSHALLLVNPSLDDSTDAINRYYERSGISRRVRRDAHITLSEKIGKSPAATDHIFSTSLYMRARTKLEMLTTGTLTALPATTRTWNTENEKGAYYS